MLCRMRHCHYSKIAITNWSLKIGRLKINGVNVVFCTVLPDILALFEGLIATSPTTNLEWNGPRSNLVLLDERRATNRRSNDTATKTKICLSYA